MFYWIRHNAVFVLYSFVLSVGPLILSGLAWRMGSGFVSSALGSTGAWESISGELSLDLYVVNESCWRFRIRCCLLLAFLSPAVLCVPSPWTSGKILSLKRWKPVEMENSGYFWSSKMITTPTGPCRRNITAKLRRFSETRWNMQMAQSSHVRQDKGHHILNKGKNTFQSFLRVGNVLKFTFANRYKCEAVVLLRCQVATLAEGKDWSMETSSARNWTTPQPKTGLSSSHR